MTRLVQLKSLIKQSMAHLFSREKKPRIEVFVRHCNYSDASAHKARFSTFSKEKCFRNLLNTIDPEIANVTFFLDSFYSSEQKHFITEQIRYPIIEIKAGNEAASFLAMLDHVSSLTLKPDTIIYFLEDDYIHKKGWTDVLAEGLSLPSVDYVTLYDHRDKYFFPDYANLQSKIFHTHSCHWRTTPSTTNTYAMRFETLKKHLDIHRQFSTGVKISADHDKFCSLNALGATLISSIPGFSTHAEPDYASPCENWEEILQKSLKDFKNSPELVT